MGNLWVEKLDNRTPTVGVIGLGYVGLPLGLAFCEAGLDVLGFDTDPEKGRMIREGRSYLRHITDARIAKNVNRPAGARFRPADDDARLAECDAIIICVPTPLDKNRNPDMTFIEATTALVAKHLRPGQLVSLESTTYPGTTEEILLPAFEAAGMRAGEEFFLVYSPEREDPGNAAYTIVNTPKLIGGVTPACLAAGESLYGRVVETLVPLRSTRSAEFAKLLENIQRAVNIGLMNEMKTVACAMGLDFREIMAGAATKPFGYTPYQPGPGLGGHCVPIDPFYLTWKAREYGRQARFIEIAGEVNHAMPEWVVDRVAEALNMRRKPVNGSRILILGLAYKKNVSDTRESPSVAILDLLAKRGADIAYVDPWVPEFPKMREYDYTLKAQPLTAETMRTTDAVILCTDHDDFDYAAIQTHAPLIIDTRGRFPAAENVVAA